MSEQNKSDDKSSPAVPTIAIVALLVSFFAAQGTILNPTRPAMIDTEKASAEDVRSRLWQDPFQAIEQYHKENGRDAKQPEKQKTDHHTPYEFYKKIKNKNKSVHVLAVMVPGGPYAENQEWRLRSRYALISGMYAAGYVPNDPEHIGFVDFKNSNKDRSLDFPDYMPYEWFELDKQLKTISTPTPIEKLGLSPSDRKESVLILWLNNDAFIRSSNSLTMLGQLKQEIISNSKAINFTIIGPHDSDTLEKMYIEVNNLPPHHSSLYYLLFDSHIFSASATADNSQLIETKEQIPSWLDAIWLQNKIIRTINTQDKLVNTLFCELALRGIAPKSPQPNDRWVRECKIPGIPGFIFGRTDKNHIVLIGESDTFYSRKLTESILKKKDEFGESSYQIHTVNYLRGLDGITSKRTSTDQDNKNKESQINKPDGKEAKEQAERPTGASQLDYLLRLAEQIKHLDKIKTEDGGIKAIGITGSDTYDKLLILQALRPKFPETLFFTTDLDARLFHPSEIKWTRNLIVASPFGLQLDDKWQKHTPSFRDNYQTALYFTTLLALHCPNVEKQCSNNSLRESIKELQINPRLFEIGNYGAVDLSHTNGNGIHPKPKNDSVSPVIFKTPQTLALAVITVVVLMLFLLYLVPQALQSITFAIFSISVILILFYGTVQRLDGYGSESLSFTNGTSIWPANGIRFVAFILAICFSCNVIKQLKENYKDSTKKYKLRRIDRKPEENDSLCSRLLIDQWKTTSNKNWLITDIWSRYLELRKFDYCSIRIIVMFVLYFVFIMTLSQAGDFGIPGIPFRGEISHDAGYTILILAVIAYLSLTFIIADVTHLSSHFVKLLASGNIDWPPEAVNSYRKYGLPTDAVKNKLLMNFICQQANAINNFIYYPFFILFLMILSRSYFFDNWQISPLLLFIFIFTALITLGSAIRLRKASEYARRCILEKLDKLLSDNAQKSTQIKSLIDEIKNLKGGVFQPLSHHPIVLSWFIPLSTIAGTYLLEYFAFSTS